MLVLGIETTCDETAVAIVEDGKRILCNKIASQADLHQRFGGVFPELACRRHIDTILPLIDETLAETSLKPDQIDLIAVAKGPGLMGALLMGLTAAKTLSMAWQKPFVGVNHIEAHLYASMMDHNPILPAIGLVLSGGHTDLIEIEALGKYRKISSTVDDAIGEAFDKVARLLDLPYPGGPEIEKLALSGDPLAYPLKAGHVKANPLAFSFSGLKTKIRYLLEEENINKADLAASFQHTALSDIVKKAKKAAKPHQAIYLGGGVTANQYLKKLFTNDNVHFPPPGLSLDNAAMIAGLGYHVYQAKGSDRLDLEATPRIPF